MRLSVALLLAALLVLGAAAPVKVYAQCIRNLDGMRQYQDSVCGAATIGFEVVCINLHQTYRCDGQAWRKQ